MVAVHHCSGGCSTLWWLFNLAWSHSQLKNNNFTFPQISQILSNFIISEFTWKILIKIWDLPHQKKSEISRIKKNLRSPASKKIKRVFSCIFSVYLESFGTKVFNNGPSKIFKGCLPQILRGPFLNTLPYFILPVSFLAHIEILEVFWKASSIQYVLKMFRKTKIS